MNTVQPIRDLEKIEEISRRLRASSERNYLMWMLGIYTGLRISDIRLLRVGDLLSQRYIVRREQKTRKEQRILINPMLRRACQSALSDREPDEYILRSRQGGNRPISRGMAYFILRDVASEAGITQGIGTHTMRKTFGYHVYQKTKDVAMLMDWFNHSNEAVTLRYIGVTQDQKDRTIQAFRY